LTTHALILFALFTSFSLQRLQPCFEVVDALHERHHGENMWEQFIGRDPVYEIP
jgi:hypothetical protein